MGRKIKTSFYDWCIENNHKDYLTRWDYKLNTTRPEDIGSKANIKIYFKCDENSSHKSECKIINNVTSQKNDILCHQCNSFGQWCLDNNKEDILELWDIGLNKISPFQVDKSSKNKYWFKCSRGIHDSELKNIASYYNGEIGAIKCIKCNSFAQYLIDLYGDSAIENYWDYNKNKISPWDISIHSSRKKIFLKCQEKDYHESYEIRCSDFFYGCRCPYCNRKSGKVHKLDSLGTLFPQSIKIWSSKNKKSPYEYNCYSLYKVHWKCNNGKHEEYYRSISNAISCEFRCPECVLENNASILQQKVSLYLKVYNYTINHEYNCSIIPRNPKTKYALPFDNEIEDIKLIIEVHGKQHYELLNEKSSWLNGKTPEAYLKQRKLYDRYKKYIAWKNGYEYLEIPYWTEKDESYKILIDNKINEILNLKTKSA